MLNELPSRTWFTADWHFSHNKDFIWKARGFSSIEEHNEVIINRHNERVGKNDIVYCLGDSFMNDFLDGLDCIRRLNGKIHIIIGNHDTRNKLNSIAVNCSNVITCDKHATIIKVGKYFLYLSHRPTIMGSICDLKSKEWCFHGHTHSTDKFEHSQFRCYNVGMDAHNCYPVSLEEALNDIREFREKQRKEEEKQKWLIGNTLISLRN